MASDPIQRLIEELAKLPGVGQKTAARLAFHLLRLPAPHVQGLAQALLDVKEHVGLCTVCINLTQQNPCALCQDPRREAQLICVVAQPQDVIAIERTGGFRGHYHVLHGVLSPLEGVGPDQLHIRELLQRLQQSNSPVTEIILATSPNVEGEATAVYLGRLLRPLGLRITRIASGLPIGGELEYADGITIRRAFEIRREL